MKNTTTLLALVVTAVVLGSTNQTNAQYKAVGDDGIAASPGVRKILNEQKATANSSKSGPQVAATKSVGFEALGDDGIAASPGVRRVLNERKAAATAAGSGAQIASSKATGYQAIGEDGIAASPGVRRLLNEHRTSVLIAPVK